MGVGVGMGVGVKNVCIREFKKVDYLSLDDLSHRKNVSALVVSQLCLDNG